MDAGLGFRFGVRLWIQVLYSGLGFRFCIQVWDLCLRFILEIKVWDSCLIFKIGICFGVPCSGLGFVILVWD